jgi:putative redox protein
MVKMEIEYNGGLHTEAAHTLSGTKLQTDAPLDNGGKGESFSPTDLVATALGTCMLTTMGIFAKRHDIDMSGAKVTVLKEMVADPLRRIGRLEVVIEMPLSEDHPQRKPLEQAALTCPVRQSLGANVETPVEFRWKA